MVKIVERVVYVASDGREFDTMEAATEWERREDIMLQLRNIFDAYAYSDAHCDEIASIIWTNKDTITALLSGTSDLLDTKGEAEKVFLVWEKYTPNGRKQVAGFCRSEDVAYKMCDELKSKQGVYITKYEYWVEELEELS